MQIHYLGSVSVGDLSDVDITTSEAVQMVKHLFGMLLTVTLSREQLT